MIPGKVLNALQKLSSHVSPEQAFLAYLSRPFMTMLGLILHENLDHGTFHERKALGAKKSVNA